MAGNDPKGPITGFKESLKESTEKLVSNDLATLATVRLLVDFLIAKGIVDRAELIAHLDDAFSALGQQKHPEAFVKALWQNIQVLQKDPGADETLPN